jgi:hypothetical protein
LRIQSKKSVGMVAVGGNVASTLGSAAIRENDSGDWPIAMVEFAKESGCWGGCCDDDTRDAMLIDDIESAQCK